MKVRQNGIPGFGSTTCPIPIKYPLVDSSFYWSSNVPFSLVDHNLELWDIIFFHPYMLSYLSLKFYVYHTQQI